MNREAFYRAEGLLRYTRVGSTFKLNVEVDPGIVEVARALAPKSVKLQPQRYPPHITVVRNELPVNFHFWGALEGQPVTFEYSPIVYNDDRYFWLLVLSPQLDQVRVELGLPRTSEWTRPPDGTEAFHITIGNTKSLNAS